MVWGRATRDRDRYKSSIYYRDGWWVSSARIALDE